MIICIAKREDIKGICDIYNQAIAAGQKTAETTLITIDDRNKWFGNRTPDKYPILVAQDGNVIIGYLTLSAYRPGRETLRFTAEVSSQVSHPLNGAEPFTASARTSK